MASISFPVTGFQPVPRDQLSSAPAGTGGPQAVDPNQQDAPQGDRVTISVAFPPAQPAQQAAAVKIQEFSIFVAQTETQASQAAAPAPTQAQLDAQTATTPAANALAAATTLDPATAAASAAATQAGVASTPQQELAQLDQTLQQLGVDPQSISLFNRIGLLLYANDPTALEDLVKALQAADQQLGQLNGAANGTTPAQNAAQALLPSTNQQQTQAAQGTANFTPEPLTHLKGATPPQAPVTPPAQLEGQNQNPAGNAPATVFAAQLSFTDVQATFQEQSTSQLGSSSNQNSANGTAPASTTQTNSLLLNFQELQLSFQQVEIQTPQQQTARTPQSAPQNQGRTLNINA
jgi:hypothetical protein